MHFEYEIPVEEYVAAQLLYYKLSAGRKRVANAVFWIFVGIFFISTAWEERSLNLSPILLAAVGAWWIYGGFRSLFPTWYYRRAYRGADLAGRKFKAEVREDDFEVTGEACSWRVRWAGVQLKGENERGFILCAANTLFMFGKKYLDNEQQRELRRLSGLESSHG